MSKSNLLEARGQLEKSITKLQEVHVMTSLLNCDVSKLVCEALTKLNSAEQMLGYLINKEVSDESPQT